MVLSWTGTDSGATLNTVRLSVVRDPWVVVPRTLVRTAVRLFTDVRDVWREEL